MPEQAPQSKQPAPKNRKPEMKGKSSYDPLQIARYLCFFSSAVFFCLFKLSDFPYLLPILLALTVIGGSFFCGWICPMGFLQDLAGLIARRFKVQQKNLLPRKVHLILMPMRFLLFASAFAGTIFAGYYLANADARRAVHTVLGMQIPGLIAALILIFFLVLSVFYKRVFCSYFCVEGAKQGLIGFFRPVTILRDPEICINCKKCDKACPMSISVSTSGNVQSPQCVNCFQCISACPCKKTLSFGLARPKNMLIGAALKNTASSPAFTFGMIGLRLALAAAVFFFWFQGPGQITYQPRFDKSPAIDAESAATTSAETGASAQSGASTESSASSTEE